MNEVSPNATMRTLPEAPTEPRRGPYGIWIHTAALGWFRSAIREDEEEAEQVAKELGKNFDRVEVR